MPDSPRGFTLLEAMFTMAILAIGATIGMPTLHRVVTRHELNTGVDELTASLALARATAIGRGRPVTVCPTRDGLVCRQDLIWEDGWMVIADGDGPGSGRPAQLLQHVDRHRKRLRISSSAGRHRIRYHPSGMAIGSNLTLNICSRNASRHLASVVVNNGGRTRSQQMAETAPCPFIR